MTPSAILGFRKRDFWPMG